MRAAAVEGGAEAATTLPAVEGDVADGAPAGITTEAATEATKPIEADADSDDTGSEAAVLPRSFLPLSVLDRITQPSVERDLTFFYAVLIVVLLHAGALVGVVRLGEAVPPNADRIGQVDDPTSVEVELVSAPSKDAKSKESQAGDPPAPPPTPALEPQPPTPPAPPQPQKPPEKPQEKPAEKAQEKPPEKPPEKPATVESKEEPLPPDENGLARPEEAKAAEAQQQEASLSLPPPPPPPAPAKKQRIEATAPHGRQSVYVNSVISAINLRGLLDFPVIAGEAIVEFEIGRNGALKGLRISKSSGNKAFDQHLIELIKSAQIPAPGAATPEDELTWSYHYIVR